MPSEKRANRLAPNFSGPSRPRSASHPCRVMPGRSPCRVGIDGDGCFACSARCGAEQAGHYIWRCLTGSRERRARGWWLGIDRAGSSLTLGSWSQVVVVAVDNRWLSTVFCRARGRAREAVGIAGGVVGFALGLGERPQRAVQPGRVVETEAPWLIVGESGLTSGPGFRAPASGLRGRQSPRSWSRSAVPHRPGRPRHPGRMARARQPDRARDLRARLEVARRLDGHDRRLRQVGPRARPAGSHLHGQLTRRATRDQGTGRGPPRALKRAAPRWRDRRRQAVQARPLGAVAQPRRSHRPASRHARRDPDRRREGRACLGDEGDGARDLRPRPHPAAVAELIDRLLSRLSRCRLKTFIRLGRTIRKHREGILAARRIKLSNARAEAQNNKVKLIVRRAYGFHSANAALALVHPTCGPITLTLPHGKRSRSFTYDHPRTA